ncbi:Alpha/beta hydrolase family protein [Polaromonas sp. OV174]|uniref:alpha/beta hydrolase family protein n=1 Tax=Polaromonas sp. OV174 TaxID=1855300 RepID=UPI0008EAA7B9|nr:prolyl oligopeptidase family serine peptidase [Polaromonas sp. OV174]SFC61845.1 Alpha/beta hydrolase family protein [Polaromonas sp. OV174]
MKSIHLLTTLATACLLAACSGGYFAPAARGSLIQNPPLLTTSLTADSLAASLNSSATGKGLLAMAGKPKCGINVQHIQYATVGGAGEATDASGALMTPSGGVDCTGARPVVLYAHGTTAAKNYNLGTLADNTNPAYGEALLIAAMYAAQGFIVVAPNYAGYDSSRLNYHPYLNADQSSKDMMDALSAARKALTGLKQPVQDSGKLFITGYSQGGHVAMATHKAMQAAGLPVAASAPMSGPYATAAFGDAIYYGNVNLGSTLFLPLLVNSYQKAYGNIYSRLTDIYEPAYATGLDKLLPTDLPVKTLFSQGLLPQTTLFSNPAPTAPAGSPPTLQATLNAISPPTKPPALAPLFALGFGHNNLMTNQSRLNYLLDAIAHPDGAMPRLTNGAPAASPAHPMRIAAKRNDLRNWTPTSPVLLCGGKGDPTVFFDINTSLMQSFWSAPSPAAPAAGLLTVLDLASASTGAADPYAAAKTGFNQAMSNTAKAAIAAGATDGGSAAVTQAYHGALLPPFCNAAARGFFQQVLARGA